MKLDHQLRPPPDQLDLLAPRDAREPVDQMRRLGTMLFHRELSDALKRLHQLRAPHADHARDRFEALFDGRGLRRVPVPKPIDDR